MYSGYSTGILKYTPGVTLLGIVITPAKYSVRMDNGTLIDPVTFASGISQPSWDGKKVYMHGSQVMALEDSSMSSKNSTAD